MHTNANILNHHAILWTIHYAHKCNIHEPNSAKYSTMTWTLCPLLLLASSLIWTLNEQFNMHHHAITQKNHYAYKCNDLDETVNNTAQQPEHYIFCSFMHHYLIWVTNSNLTFVSQTSNLPQQYNNCRCPLHHSHSPPYYPAKPTIRNIHTFQWNTDFSISTSCNNNLRKTYIVCRKCSLDTPSKISVCQCHCIKPYFHSSQ